MISYKKCSRCKKLKPLSDFHRATRTKTGYASACKNCKSLINKKSKKKIKKKTIDEFLQIFMNDLN